MSTPLRVLVLEDSLVDAELLLYELRRAGFAIVAQRVETEADYLAQLPTRPDAIFADYTLPQFNALNALHLLQERGLDIPFIVITGTLSEEAAVECMKQGAADYLLKDRLSRLGPALTRALHEKELRDQKRQAEAAMRESEARFRLLAENSTDMISRHAPDAAFVYVSPACRSLLGYAPEELLGHSIFELFHPGDQGENEKTYAALLSSPDPLTVTRRFRHKDGTYLWFESTLHSIFDPQSGAMIEIHASSRDVTARKRAEAAIQEDAEVSAALARVGRELIAALDTPAMLDRLCQLAAEVLGCQYGFTALRQTQKNEFVIVAHWGYSPEQAVALHHFAIPRAAFACPVARLQEHDIAVTHDEPLPPELAPTLATPQRGGDLISLALRHGRELIGIQVCGYAPHHQPPPYNLRLAQGISQIASLALASARLIRELEQANRLKSDFLATVSHELRTPVNVIMGYTELFLEAEFGPVNEEQINVLRRVDKSSRELEALIMSTLEVSRIEAGQAPVSVVEVHLPDLLREIEDETRDLLREKPGVCFSWNAAPELPEIRTDRAKLKVVLKNLVNNAVKFTESGSVTADAHLRDGGVEVSVTDTGIGITPEVLPHIFEMFRQGDGSSTRRYGGVGLGLYIVHRLLELLGGTISVESQVQRGSTFRAWLPLNAGS